MSDPRYEKYKKIEKEINQIENDLKDEDLSNEFKELLVLKRHDLLVDSNSDDKTICYIRKNKSNNVLYTYINSKTKIQEGDICIISRSNK